MNHWSWRFLIYVLFIPHSRAGSSSLLTRVSDSKQIFELSLCSFSDDTLLNYSCHDKESAKPTEVELNAFEVTELLCGNYSKSQEEDCKRVSFIFLDLQMHGLCIASSSITLLQPTVTLQLYESHKPYFAVCIKSHNQSESQYQYEHTFDCTSNQTRELTLNITEFNSINNNNNNTNAWQDPWTTIVQINIVVCETPSILSNYTNLGTTEKENSLLHVLLIIGGIGGTLITLLLFTITGIAVYRIHNRIRKEKKLFKESEKEDNKILRTTTLKLQKENITNHGLGFQRDSITTACSVHGPNLQEIHNMSLPISTCSDPQKVNIIGKPLSSTNTNSIAFCQQRDTIASISSKDTISTGSDPEQVCPTASISPTDTILTGCGPEQACPTASTSPADTISTCSDPQQACTTPSTSSTGSCPK